jgi:hypothetical protein
MEATIATKRCTGPCGLEKPLTEFFENKNCKDGRVGQCKTCLLKKQQARKAGWRANGYDRPARKTCAYCGKPKAADEFNHDFGSWDSLSPGCKVCNRERRQVYHFRKSYGMEPGDYEAMLEQQGGRCLICGRTDPGSKGRFHVDHDHDTGRVRGLLCERCNIGIGYFSLPAHLVKAAIYLRSFSATDKQNPGD